MTSQLESKEIGELPPHRALRLWLYAAIVVGAAVRIYLALSASVIARDATQYVTIARRMVVDWRAELPQAFPLGYPLLIRAAHALGGSQLSADPIIAWQRSGQLVSLLLGIACIPLVYQLGRCLLGARCGVIAAWIWALLPHAAALSADALTDMPNLALSLAGLMLVMRWLRGGGMATLFMAGLLSGAAYTMRTEGGELAAVAVAVVLAVRGATLKRRAIGAVAVILGFALVGGSYILLEGGRVVNKQTWMSEQAASIVGNEQWHAAMLGGGNSLPRACGIVVEKLFSATNGVWMVLATAFIFVPGIQRMRRSELRAPRAFWAFHVAVLLWFCTRSGYLSGRHVMLLATAIAILSAGTLNNMAQLAMRAVETKRWLRHADIAALVVTFAALMPWLLRDIGGGRWHVRQAADWVKQHYPNRTPNMIACDGWVPFYAGATQWSDYNKPADLATNPELATADLVIADSRDEQAIRRFRLPSLLLTEVARFTSERSDHGVVINKVEIGIR